MFSLTFHYDKWHFKLSLDFRNQKYSDVRRQMEVRKNSRRVGENEKSWEK
jgi:hypothetical protein